MNMNNRTYPSKILLCGEYTVLHGSSALAIPFHKYFGSWLKTDTSPEGLYKFHEYLMNHLPKSLLNRYDIEAAESDIKNGIAFSSTIPYGKGLGSSGSLTAAWYDRYFEIPSDESSHLLKSDLSLIEQFFHGQSSGIDPLVSYKNKAILRNSTLTTVELPSTSLKNFYLIDSGIPRDTQKLVKQFHEDIYPKHAEKIDELAGMNDKLINEIIEEHSTLYSVKMISQIQFEIMKPMIVSPIRELWEKGLEDGSFSMKLCGAGGGGYYIFINHSLEDFSELGELEILTIAEEMKK